jgi:hypothetical protein
MYVQRTPGGGAVPLQNRPMFPDLWIRMYPPWIRVDPPVPCIPDGFACTRFRVNT